MERTLPKALHPEGLTPDPKDLAAGRYGTFEMIRIWGPERTFDCLLRVQSQAAVTLSRLHPDIVPPEHATEIAEKANLHYVNPQRIRDLEKKTGHDIIAVNTALEEVVSREAAAHINKAKTSADTTQPARALQLRASLEVVIDSVENLRDIVIEKALAWKDIPHMDQTHLYDALPTVVGRPFAHYAEMLQSNLEILRFACEHSIIGKWSDATGNHHSARALGIDGIALEEAYCKDLGLGHMVAAAQLPGLEFEADIVYALARTGETLSNLAEYVAMGRGDDRNIFINGSPKKKKGSSAMPHKDAKNGNPTTEEQVESVRNKMRGWMTTALSNCRMPYARNLAASANSRIDFEDGFKFLDHGIRNLAETVYWLDVQEEVAASRVERSYGVVTAQQLMTYLTDYRKVKDPLPRSEAHDLTARLATEAWKSKAQFVNIVLLEPAITSRMDEATIRQITNPLQYVGESKRIIELVAEKYYQKKTRDIVL